MNEVVKFVKESNGKVFAYLESGSKIPISENNWRKIGSIIISELKEILPSIGKDFSQFDQIDEREEN